MGSYGSTSGTRACHMHNSQHLYVSRLRRTAGDTCRSLLLGSIGITSMHCAGCIDTQHSTSSGHAACVRSVPRHRLECCMVPYMHATVSNTRWTSAAAASCCWMYITLVAEHHHVLLDIICCLLLCAAAWCCCRCPCGVSAGA